jgi:DNA-directed RNA polymerase specialized sigma24 family protein
MKEGEGYTVSNQIFAKHEVRGYAHHEIARLLRCSVGNSKSQLHKAKISMRKLLDCEHKIEVGKFPQR